MLLWRLTMPRYRPGLDGEGARLAGGRWNSPGVAMVYTASSLALAALETFVHLDPLLRVRANLPRLIAVGVVVPDDLVTEFDWRTLPAGHGIPDYQTAGNVWSKAGSSLGLAVPSHVIPRENNILLNPRHPDMVRVVVKVTEDFVFDDWLGM